MLLPHREIEWNTYKDPDTVIRTVNSMTEATTKPWKTESSRLFWGSVGTDSFQIGPYFGTMVNYSTCIRITGAVSAAEPGTHIRLIFEMNPYARIFMRFWYGGLLFFFLLSLPILPQAPMGAVVPACMFLFGQALIGISFKIQADKAISILQNVLPST